MSAAKPNLDGDVVAGFGDEWTRFDQTGLSAEERDRFFREYFAAFPWDALPADGGVGADIGCGSGRWALAVAPRVRKLHVVDASDEALTVARRNLREHANVSFYHASVDDLPFADGSLDFAYSLGVLHHVPDTAAGIRAIARKLKPGAPILLYLYYAFDNRPAWFQRVWRASDYVRRTVSSLPFGARYAVSQGIAAGVYWPLARSARALASVGALPPNWPLSYYREASFYSMRTDALDRFGTRLEQRFTREQIRSMMYEAGLTDVRFSESVPYWCAVGRRPAAP